MEKFIHRMSNYGFLLIPVLIAVLVMLLNHYGCGISVGLNPELSETYFKRGTAYYQKGDFDRAIIGYNKAIDLNPEYAETYYTRGSVWLHLSEWEKAKADLTTAKNMGINIVAAFHNFYESVADFEVQHGVQVPEDIAALLRRY